MSGRRLGGVAGVVLAAGWLIAACGSSSNGITSAGSAACHAASSNTSTAPSSTLAGALPLPCTIVDPVARFTVAMPGSPAKSTKNTTAPDGSGVTIVGYQWASADSKTVYTVSYEQFPGTMQQELANDPKTFFDAVTSTYQQSILPAGSPSTTAVAQVSNSTFQGRPEQTAVFSQDPAQLQVMMFTNQNFLIILSVASPNTGAAAAGISSMSSSFTFQD